MKPTLAALHMGFALACAFAPASLAWSDAVLEYGGDSAVVQGANQQNANSQADEDEAVDGAALLDANADRDEARESLYVADGFYDVFGFGQHGFTRSASSTSDGFQPQGREHIPPARTTTQSGSATSRSVAYKDGVYRALGEGGKFGQVPVTVTIRGGEIVSVAIGENSESAAMLQKAKDVVVSQVLAKQMCVDIETATGATFSSTAIIDGIGKALERAARR